MEQIYKNKMQAVGYDQHVCDIFVNWEDVKDELLIPERKKGSGNGTIHVFLGAADEVLRKEFPQYYASVQNETDATNGAIEIKHYFLSSNIISMLGYVCQYNYERHYDIMPQIEEILGFVAQSTTIDGMLSTKSLFKLSTGATKLRPYFKQFESNGVFAKIIRKILLPNSAYKISLYKNNNNEYAAFWLIGFNNVSDFEADSNVEYFASADNIGQTCHQIIYYGAPGTGKSHKIKEQLKGVSKENIFRTTFHPDSDYSTFVGAYKPTMEKPMDKVYAKGELISKLTEMKEGGVTYSPQKFGAKYWRSLKQLNLSDKKDILQACGMSDNYTVEFDKGMAVGEEYLACSNESRIIYSFVPQAFLNAYIRAYQTDENVYLIIEEINRGNCAQIFGDLFQLLDRNENGVSEYTTNADTDLKSFLEEELGEDNPGIKDGKLCLPSNLYIYATMNTSDQSLFPVDSAFKRRWDWKYIPIAKGNDNGVELNWMIDIDGDKYDWWTFIKTINKHVFDTTNSEDKQLGFFFCKAKNNIINAETFVSKVIFYLWNDVFKDFGFENPIFADKNDAANPKLSFDKFYLPNGKIRIENVSKFLTNLGLLPVEFRDELIIDESDDLEEDSMNTDDNAVPSSKRDYSRFSINGEGQFKKSAIAAEVMKLYINDNPNLTVDEIALNWGKLNNIVARLVQTEAEYNDYVQSSKEAEAVQRRFIKLELSQGSIIYVSNQFNPSRVERLSIAIEQLGWPYKIERIAE